MYQSGKYGRLIKFILVKCTLYIFIMVNNKKCYLTLQYWLIFTKCNINFCVFLLNINYIFKIKNCLFLLINHSSFNSKVERINVMKRGNLYMFVKSWKKREIWKKTICNGAPLSCGEIVVKISVRFGSKFHSMILELLLFVWFFLIFFFNFQYPILI